MPIGFEWDEEKAASNIRDHDGVAFEQAAAAFSDTFAVEWIDEREDYGEERSVLLGMTGYPYNRCRKSRFHARAKSKA